MIHHKLSNIISTFAHKRLKAVECLASQSNQHEFNGVSKLKEILGTETLRDFPVKIIYWGDKDDEIIVSNTFLTWYDAREQNPNRSPEYRLYFKNNNSMNLAKENDLFIFFQSYQNDKIQRYILIAPESSTSEKQLQWLFDIEIDLFSNRLNNQDMGNKKIDMIVTRILEFLEIEYDISNDSYLDALLENFDEFPSTKVFSEYARNFAEDVDPVLEPDNAIIAYMEIENILFKTYEKYIVEKHLQDEPFKNVDSFLSYSLSVQNRRKSRAGHSFENHLQYIFKENNVDFSYNQVTENNYKPDFIFPNIECYHDEDFNPEKLIMLAAKTTCKDRWRQALSEANRIHTKHLITIEPAISTKQTIQMKTENLKLVIPESIQSTYDDDQIPDIMNFSNFIDLVTN